MAEASTLHDALVDELRDTYDAEKQLTKALSKLAKAASSPKLREAFETHLEETLGHIERLEQVFEGLDEKVRGRHCDGIAGIIEEGKSIMEEDFDDITMDACLIAAGQRAEHYEMAAYGTLIAWAQAMGHTEPAKLLQQTLDEEKAADKNSQAWPTRRIPMKSRSQWGPARAPVGKVPPSRKRAAARGLEPRYPSTRRTRGLYEQAIRDCDRCVGRHRTRAGRDLCAGGIRSTPRGAASEMAEPGSGQNVSG
jgi:ferritin-like metal-binding protein YciE